MEVQYGKWPCPLKDSHVTNHVLVPDITLNPTYKSDIDVHLTFALHSGVLHRKANSSLKMRILLFHRFYYLLLNLLTRSVNWANTPIFWSCLFRTNGAIADGSDLPSSPGVWTQCTTCADCLVSYPRPGWFTLAPRYGVCWPVFQAWSRYFLEPHSSTLFSSKVK